MRWMSQGIATAAAMAVLGISAAAAADEIRCPDAGEVAVEAEISTVLRLGDPGDDVAAIEEFSAEAGGDDPLVKSHVRVGKPVRPDRPRRFKLPVEFDRVEISTPATRSRAVCYYRAYTENPEPTEAEGVIVEIPVDGGACYALGPYFSVETDGRQVCAAGAELCTFSCAPRTAA